MMSRSEQGLERLGRRFRGWLPVLECAGSASFARWQADRLINCVIGKIVSLYYLQDLSVWTDSSCRERSALSPSRSRPRNMKI